MSFLCSTFAKFLYLQVIDEFDQNVHFVEIDIEEDPEIAEAAGIMGTPCVQFFKNKEMLRFGNLALIILFSLHHALYFISVLLSFHIYAK